MRYVGRSSGLFWAVALGFAAGAICVSIAPSLRSPSVQGQADSSISESDSTSIRRSVEAVSSVDRSPASSSRPLEGESIKHLAWADQGLQCIETITARNIFRRGRNPASRSDSPSSSDSGEVAGQTQAQATRPPPFRLLGTVASDERDSYAVLEMIETKAQDIYRIGQTIGDARIDRIEQNRVVVVRDGSRGDRGTKGGNAQDRDRSAGSHGSFLSRAPPRREGRCAPERAPDHTRVGQL